LTIVVDDELQQDNESDSNHEREGTRLLTSPPAWIGVSENPKGLLRKEERLVKSSTEKRVKGSAREGNIGLVTLDKSSVSLSRLDDRDREIFKRDLGKRRNRQWEIAKRRLREKGLLLR